MRQLFALLTSLSMLHLMLVGGDLACASHGAGAGQVMAGMTAASMSPAAHTSMTDGGSGVTGAHSVAQPTDCATPTQNRCCAAMSNCGVTTDVTAAERFAMGTMPATMALHHASSLLTSVLIAPEPPPPRA